MLDTRHQTGSSAGGWSHADAASVQALGFADMAALQAWLTIASVAQRDAAMLAFAAILGGGEL
jgi:hypothetical protein